MEDKHLKTFIDVVIDYFNQITGEQVLMGVPYIQTGEQVILEYSGIIGVSGEKRGAILLTAGRQFLADLTEVILGEKLEDDRTLTDMAGEVTNTIAGNSRDTFGSNFMISVPIVIKGAPREILFHFKPPVFVIPLKWRNYDAYLSIGLE